MADRALPLKWRIVVPRPGVPAIEPEAYATVVPKQLREFAAHLLRTNAENCEVILSSCDKPKTLWGMSLVAFHRVYTYPSRPGPEHPLVPEEWHGLGYKPLSRQELPDPSIPAYFRGVRYGEPVESIGYCPQDKLVVYVQGEPIAVDSPAFSEDAIFAWRPISDYDWKCSYCEVEIDDTNYGQLTEKEEDNA